MKASASLLTVIAALAFCLPLGVVGCEGDAIEPSAVADGAIPEDAFSEAPPFEAAGPRLSRLTRRQYRATIHDLFGTWVAVPTNLEPDTEQHGLYAVGSTVASVSPLGVERYADAARNILGQLLESEEGRAALLVCEPLSATDPECLSSIVSEWGARIWRRALTEEEVSTTVALGIAAATTLESFDEAVRYALSALLQSPNFLYRVELGEEADGVRRYTNVEMASRLSYALWNTGPDEALLAAAKSGDLTRDDGLAAQVDRLLESDRARMGTRNFFAEWLELYHLDKLNKDPTIFFHFSAELGSAAREETLAMLERLVFDEDADIREMFHDRTAWVDRRLASIYNVPAAVDDGFGAIVLPEDGPRAGFLGQVSFLGLQAHAVSSSPTVRGVFVRERLLCQAIPTPPANLNTAIPEASKDAVTLKERLQVHMEDPSCAGCHAFIDPVGFGLEHFDGLGRYRILDNGGLIDTRGEIDGTEFDGARELAQVISDHPDFTSCVVEKLYTYLTGHAPEDGELGTLEDLEAAFTSGGHKVRALLREIVLSPGFRQVREVTP
jgi:hypothetical protein